MRFTLTTRPKKYRWKKRFLDVVARASGKPAAEVETEAENGEESTGASRWPTAWASDVWTQVESTITMRDAWIIIMSIFFVWWALALLDTQRKILRELTNMNRVA